MNKKAVDITIAQVEREVEAALSALRPILHYPDGFRPVVQYVENGRKKRRDVSIGKWSAANGEIHISFEPGEVANEVASKDAAPQGSSSESTPPKQEPKESNMLAELLAALQEAETAPGRSFVALKWFRDEYLPKWSSGRYGWTHDAELRQSVLSDAIRDGWIVTSKTANPKAPLYPTTSIRLNRQKQDGLATRPAARFRPVPITGQPLSATILGDRGAR